MFDPHENFIVLRNHEVLESSNVKIYDLGFLHGFETGVVEPTEDVIKQAKQVAVELIDANLYHWASQVTRWLQVWNPPGEQFTPREIESAPEEPKLNAYGETPEQAQAVNEPIKSGGPRARFNDDEVREIRKTGKKVGYQALADQYNVGYSTIYNIVAGKTYKEVV